MLISTTLQDIVDYQNTRVNTSERFREDNEDAVIKKQAKFIKKLYEEHPLAVVAGGCPTNHVFGYGAKDIDVYVGSYQEFHDILRTFKSDESSFVRLGRDMPEGYTGNHIDAVYEGLLPVPRVRKKCEVLVNIIIIPSLQPLTSRVTRAVSVVDQFPYFSNMRFYAEFMGTLYLISHYQALRNPMAVRTNAASKEYESRLLAKMLVFMGSAVLQNTRIDYTSMSDVSVWKFRRVLGDGRIKYGHSYPHYPSNSIHVLWTTYLSILSRSTTFEEARDAIEEARKALAQPEPTRAGTQESRWWGTVRAMRPTFFSWNEASARPQP